MPTVLRWNGYRDGRLARNLGFSAKEIAELSAKVAVEIETFEEAWHGYFGD